MNNLEKLDISSCIAITDEAILPLQKHNLSHLKELNISATAISLLAIRKFAEMECADSLQVLNLSSCHKIDWKALRFLKNFPNLTGLDISSTNLEMPFGLEPLKECSKIEILNINHIRYSEFSIFRASDVTPIIAEMPLLKRLSIAGIENQESFKEIRSTIQIHY